jgi:hypothetical protein
MGSLSMIVHLGVRPNRQKGDKGVNGKVFYCPNEKVVEKGSFWLISFNNLRHLVLGQTLKIVLRTAMLRICVNF